MPILIFFLALPSRPLSAEEAPGPGGKAEYPVVRLGSSAGILLQDQTEALFGQAQVRLLLDLSLPLGQGFFLDPFVGLGFYSDSAKIPVTYQYKAGSTVFSGGLGFHWSKANPEGLAPYFGFRAFAEQAKMSLAPLYYFYPSLRAEGGVLRYLGASLFSLGLYGEIQLRKDPQAAFAFGLFASVYPAP